jgi:hypothetical protein
MHDTANLHELIDQRRALAAQLAGMRATKIPAPHIQQARELLKARGTPFSEKTVATQEEIDALKKLAGEAVVPTLQVGRQVQRGFSSELYDKLLDAAAYPGRRPPAREE